MFWGAVFARKEAESLVSVRVLKMCAPQTQYFL